MREISNTNPFRAVLDSPAKKRLVENFLSLSALKIIRRLLPLVTFPYLVRVLGPEKFGLIAFASAFIQYFIILTDYGFQLSATRAISINRGKGEKISEIFSSVMMVKFLLWTLSLSILVSLLILIPKFRNNWLLYIFSFGTVLGDLLFPTWFFRGMERMKYITFLDIGTKVASTTCIFIFIRNTQDYLYLPLIGSLRYSMAGILSLGIIFKKFGIRFKPPSIENIISQFKEGWPIFISTIAMGIYSETNAFILGLFAPSTVVGYFSAAKKIISGVLELLTPLSQTVYPHISKLASESKIEALNFIRRLLFLVGGGMFLISFFIFLFAPLIVKLALGTQYQASITVLRILAFLPFIIGLSNVFGIQTMLTFNLKRPFTQTVILAAILNVLLSLLFTPSYQHLGIATAMLITEIFVTLSMFLYLRKKGVRVLFTP